MRRIVTALAAAVVLTGAATTVAIADGAPDIQHPQTLRLLATTDRHTTLDFQAKGFSLGDQQIFAGFLTNGSGTDFGRFDVACTATDTLAEGSLQCVFTLALPHGLVTAQGLASAVGPQSTAAVTGGTGRYQNVRGQVLVRDVTPTRAWLTLMLLP